MRLMRWSYMAALAAIVIVIPGTVRAQQNIATLITLNGNPLPGTSYDFNTSDTFAFPAFDVSLDGNPFHIDNFHVDVTLPDPNAILPNRPSAGDDQEANPNKLIDINASGDGSSINLNINAPVANIIEDASGFTFTLPAVQHDIVDGPTVLAYVDVSDVTGSLKHQGGTGTNALIALEWILAANLHRGATVPEPGSLSLLVGCTVIAGGLAWRRRSRY